MPLKKSNALTVSHGLSGSNLRVPVLNNPYKSANFFRKISRKKLAEVLERVDFYVTVRDLQYGHTSLWFFFCVIINNTQRKLCFLPARAVLLYAALSCIYLFPDVVVDYSILCILS